MKKTKKLIKKALSNPELYTDEELQYMKLVRKATKNAKKKSTRTLTPPE
jgi:TfoX/Sxy family transcriptional regulator of competence genes